MQKMILSFTRITAFILTLILCRWIFRQQFSITLNFLCIVGTMLTIFPIVFIGRRILDLNPTTERLNWVTTIVHALLMVLFGIAILRAIQTAGRWQGWVIPVDHRIGLFLIGVTGFFVLLTVANLALSGLGAPFAIALSRRLATSWLYTWTRNPMVLSMILFLLAVGLWLQSALFMVWVLALPVSAELTYLKLYEERELEIRFGQSYRDYKARTSFLWPKKPRRD
jgi:protein-S-isoprenylcysteine O-methyltransferase Ste14